MPNVLKKLSTLGLLSSLVLTLSGCSLDPEANRLISECKSDVSGYNLGGGTTSFRSVKYVSDPDSPWVEGEVSLMSRDITWSWHHFSCDVFIDSDGTKSLGSAEVS